MILDKTSVKIPLSVGGSLLLFWSWACQDKLHNEEKGLQKSCPSETEHYLP